MQALKTRQEFDCMFSKKIGVEFKGQAVMDRSTASRQAHCASSPPPQLLARGLQQDQAPDPGWVRQHNLRMGNSQAPQSTQFCPAEQRASAGGEGERQAAELQVYLELATIRDKLKVCMTVPILLV